MAKTLRLKDGTHDLLRSLREKSQAKSYDELIQRLLVKSGEISAFGKDPDLPVWQEEEDRAKFREE